MAKRHPMRVIVIAATKGGVGKTTLASALAVMASEESARVALIDTDPQASLARWWELRGNPDNPKLFGLDAATEALELLMSQGWEWVFIDTPPAFLDRIESAVSLADYVLIPTRTSPIDLEAVSDVVAICKDHSKAFAFVLNQVQSAWGSKVVSEAVKYLAEDGPVLDAKITLRKSYTTAMTSGKSGPERDSHAREEVAALWASLKSHLRRRTRA